MVQVHQTKGWMMVRVSQETHRLLTALQVRRENGRMLGRIKCRHEHVTQDDVVAYLIDCEASLQERRRRSRVRNMTRRSSSERSSRSEGAAYTPGSVAETEGKQDG